MTTERIKLTMTTMEAVMALAEGNPGAIRVCVDLLKDDKTDPDSMMGGLGNLLSLDTLGVYGPRVWMFYKDVCGQNTARMLMLMRAWQLGYLPHGTLSCAIDNRGQGISIDDLAAKVAERLPRFKMDGVRTAEAVTQAE